MPILPQELSEVMQAIEGSAEPTTDHDISAAIGKVVKELKDRGNEIGVELKAEAMAFDFCENYQNDQTGWGIYYGPQMVLPRGDKYVEYPSIQSVTPEVLAYWHARSQEATHPMLRCRYADLVWDFSPLVVNKKADILCARTMIDAAIDLANRGLAEHSNQACDTLERALSVALSIGDNSRVSRLAETMICFEDATAKTELEGTWGFSYDQLVENKKISLTDGQVATIVDALEARLKEAAEVPAGQETSRDPFAAEHAAIRLARHYRRCAKPDEVKRVLAVYTGAFEVMSRKASAMLGTAWMRKVFDVLTEFDQKHEADAVAVLMRELGKGTSKEMAKFSHKMEIPNERIEAYLTEITDGDDDTVIARIARTFVPDPKKAEMQLKEVASGAVLWGMTSHVIVDSEGREIARVGSVQDDLEGRIVMMMSQNMQLESRFLHMGLNRWVAKFGVTAESLADRLVQSPLFAAERRGLLVNAVGAYLQGDHASAVHILVPQIEQAFRNFVALSKRSIYKKGRHGGLNVKALDDLLRDPIVEHVFGANAVQYFKVLLTDQRGWNVRNNICHGLIDVPDASPILTDRLVHLALILSMVRQGEDGAANGEAQQDSK